MPYMCIVPMCRGNYAKGPKVSVFKFPENEENMNKWKLAIPRSDWTITKNSRVCELHFKDEDIIKEQKFYNSTGHEVVVPLARYRLAENAIPSKFPGCPLYLTKNSNEKRESPFVKRERLQNKQMKDAVAESLKTKMEEDKRFLISNYSDFLKCLCTEKISTFWSIIKKESRTMFLVIDEEVAPLIKCSVVVHENLEVLAYIGTSKLNSYVKETFPIKISDFRDLLKILNFVEILIDGKESNFANYAVSSAQQALENLKIYFQESENLINFLLNQINLLAHEKHLRRYAPDNLILSVLLFSISPHAYKFLRKSNSIILPHPSTIKKISGNFNLSPYEQFDVNFLCYAKEKFRTLESHDKVVSLMVDEIYIKEYFDYKAGNVVGMAFDSKVAATSAHVFMIQSMLSPYKDVIHILPVKTLSGDNLHKIIKRIILGLEDIGFSVICVVSDNNSINRKAMSNFSNPPEIKITYPHPCQKNRPLFFVIDTVHILKSIRNNWINQRNPEQCMYYPDFDNPGSNEIKTASFHTLRKLHELEKGDIVTYNRSLTYKALNPSNLERQNVKLALQIFNDFVVKALTELGSNHNLNFYEDTAKFVDLILRWWNIVNVKHPKKGIRKRNAYMMPLTLQPNDQCTDFLNSMYVWLESWAERKMNTGILTKETHLALKHSTYALVEMARYCIEELNFKYFLCGKIQTDALEERFGKYRRLAGSQYNVSLRQVFESESKLRLQSSLSLKSNKFGIVPINKFDFPISWDNIEATNFDNISITVEQEDLINDENIMPVLTFLTGYCVFSTCKHLKCEFCLNELTLNKQLTCEDSMYKLISNLDRGALKYPVPEAILIVHHCYVVIKKLLSAEHEDIFLKKMNHRQLALSVSFKILKDEGYLHDLGSCDEHDAEWITKRILWAASNIYLKNYSKMRNDQPNVPKKIRKRKLETLIRGSTCKT